MSLGESGPEGDHPLRLPPAAQSLSAIRSLSLGTGGEARLCSQTVRGNLLIAYVEVAAEATSTASGFLEHCCHSRPRELRVVGVAWSRVHSPSLLRLKREVGPGSFVYTASGPTAGSDREGAFVEWRSE